MTAPVDLAALDALMEGVTDDDARLVIVKATWKSCVHGGGWWVARDADGVERLLAPDGFADALAADLAATRAALAEAQGEVERLRDAGIRALALLRADGRGDTDIAMSLNDALKGPTP